MHHTPQSKFSFSFARESCFLTVESEEYCFVNYSNLVNLCNRYDGFLTQVQHRGRGEAMEQLSSILSIKDLNPHLVSKLSEIPKERSSRMLHLSK